MNINTIPSADFSSLAYAFAEPAVRAELKTYPEDFIVEEIIDYELSRTGEHLWCWVEKSQQNTDWVAGQLAKWANTSKRNVGYAGKKDRQAVTRQWFSIHLPGKADPDENSLNIEGVKILRTTRHNRKLQRGGLAANQFTLRLRNLNFVSTADNFDIGFIQQAVEATLEQIKSQGFPNYFGEQRFGHNGQNLLKAEQLFLQEPSSNKKDRHHSRNRKHNKLRNQEGLYISAARSWMFNVLLSQRIRADNWNQYLSGDVLQLEGSKRWFSGESEVGEDLTQRVLEQDIHPTGALFGDGDLPSQAEAKVLEQGIMERFPSWMQGLQNRRVMADRRALRVLPKALKWQWINESEILDLQISFTLPAGSYATMLLREVLITSEPEKRVFRSSPE